MRRRSRFTRTGHWTNPTELLATYSPPETKIGLTAIFIPGGEMGIRTPDTVARIHAFQACSLNHSDTSPTLDSPIIP